MNKLSEPQYHYGEHIVYSCRYHVIFCPKYRRKVLVDGIDTRLKEILPEIAESLGGSVLEMEVIPLGDLNLKISSALYLNQLYSVLLFIILKIVFCGVMTLLFVKGKERWSSN